MDSPLLTAGELRELATPYPELIIKHIRNKNLEKAREVCREMRDSQILLHDFFAESCTILWSWVGEHLGEASVEDMFRYIFDQSARRQFFDAAVAEAPPHLSVILLAKSWRAHSCFQAGDYPGNFSIHEDHEKFTFRLDPCGSGLRLWKKGIYDDPNGGKVSEKSRPWTYNRKGLPYYCIHCPFLNELLPYESSYGSIMWPVDPPHGPDDFCQWHIYKDRNDIPDAYYKRLGIRRPRLKKNKYVSAGRNYFSAQELQEMARPVTSRIIEKIHANELSAAIRLTRQVKDEFLVLHDLYVNMLAATFTFIMENAGEKGMEKALKRQYDVCIQQQFCDKLKSMDSKNTVIFLARRIFGTDLCNSSGYQAGKMTISETEENLFIKLHPCGSGGRLIRAGAYRKMSVPQKLRERIENRLIETLCRYLKFPEKLLEMVFPVFVKHFTQRKPVAQAFVKKPYPWSFEKSDIPAFCCQCGVIHEKYKTRGLEIFPPQTRKTACVWKISKKFLYLSHQPD